MNKDWFDYLVLYMVDDCGTIKDDGRTDGMTDDEITVGGGAMTLADFKKKLRVRKEDYLTNLYLKSLSKKQCRCNPMFLVQEGRPKPCKNSCIHDK